MKTLIAILTLITFGLNAQVTVNGSAPSLPIKTYLSDTDYVMINKQDSNEVAIIQMKYLKAYVTGGIKDTTPSSGNTVKITTGIPTLYVHGTGTIATLTITLPQSPLNGQVFSIVGDQTITSLTVTGGTLVSGVSTFNPSSPLRWIYDSNQSKWTWR